MKTLYKLGYLLRTVVFLSGAVVLSACTTPDGGSAPSPNPPEATAIEQGYAADQHAGLVAPAGVLPEPGERATVALLIADDWGDCSGIRGGLKRELDGWDITCVGLNDRDSEHGIMVLSEALKPLQGLDSAKEDVHIFLYGFLTDGDSGSLSRLTRYVSELLTRYDFVIWNNSWGMPRGIYSDHESRSIFAEFVATTDSLLTANPNLFVVYAAGNEGPVEAGYPQSMFNDSDVVVVGATKRDGTTAQFTSWSSSVDFTAHGDNVHVLTKGGGWTQVRGTSFSSPNVAGQISKIVHLGPDQTRQQVMIELESEVEADLSLSYPNPVVGKGDLSNARQKRLSVAWGPGWVKKYLAFPFVRTKTVDLPNPKNLSP